MKQTSSLTRNLTAAQESATLARSTQGVLYRLYVGIPDSTSHREAVASIVARYFPGATIYGCDGLWQGSTEYCNAIDILATANDLQQIVSLAGDLRHVYGQDCVLVVWSACSSLLVTA